MPARPPRIPTRLLLFALALTATSAATVQADWIRLKDGAQVHGKIILHTDERITLKSTKGTFSFDSRQVAEVHRTSPLPLPKPEGKPEVSSEVMPPDATESRALAKEQRLDKSRLVLPLTFVLKQGRTKVKGFDGEILGIYEEKETEAIVSVTADDKLPLDSSDVSTLANRLRRHLGERKEVKVDSLEPTTIDNHPAVIAQFTEERKGATVRHIQVWLLGERCYALSIAVPERKYRLNSLRYGTILKSFRLD
ncbi:MAG: hypothetical protein KDC38_20385 [Planctomycetes bacterium]|nr:hypothetical protein [Planctomycetota bacterium]